MMSDEPPYVLEIEGIEDPSFTEADKPLGKRRWVGVHFECCGTYTRIYKNSQGTAYVGYCPRCAQPVRVRIGPDGSNHRMFRAY